YTPSEIHTFRTLARVLVLSADSRQKIYGTPDCMATLRDVTDSAVILQHHYRIGRRICIVADSIGVHMPNYEPMLQNCQYDESEYPSSVLPVPSTSVDSQAEAIVEHLTTQLDAYPEALIGVIAPTNAIVDQVWDVIARSQHALVAIKQANDEHPEFTEGTRISVSTIHSAKGLEFRAVHIVGAERLQSSVQGINLTFTAITRAKTSVHLHHTGTLPGFLEKAIREVQPPRPLPSLASLFGRKGTK
ncbi:MAG: ATP-binding domain-containing protein, partial [Woeseiaceae bacterium]